MNLYFENFSNQVWGACLRPYNVFFSLQTYLESCETLGGVPNKLLIKDLYSKRLF